VPGLIRLLGDQTLAGAHDSFVQALGQIGDARANPILAQIRDLWAGDDRLSLFVNRALDEIRRRDEAKTFDAKPPDPDSDFVHFECRACGAKLKAKQGLGGKKASCPLCGAVIVVAARPAPH
jgi:hypothetical protein